MLDQIITEGYAEFILKEEGIENPTTEQINTKVNSLKVGIQRRTKYPSIGDQLDDLFKAGAFSTEMTAKIQAVKDKYPKE